MFGESPVPRNSEIGGQVREPYSTVLGWGKFGFKPRTVLGVDSPFFSAVVLFKNQPFSQGFTWKESEVTPRTVGLTKPSRQIALSPSRRPPLGALPLPLPRARKVARPPGRAASAPVSAAASEGHLRVEREMLSLSKQGNPEGAGFLLGCHSKGETSTFQNARTPMYCSRDQFLWHLWPCSETQRVQPIARSGPFESKSALLKTWLLATRVHISPAGEHCR